MSHQTMTSETAATATLSRRSFLKWTAALGGTAALASGGLHFGLKKAEAAPQAAPTADKWVAAACWHNCGGRCLIKANVVGGVITRVKTDDTHPDSVEFPQQRGCQRGRAQRGQIMGADRLKYPMKRAHWAPGGGDKSLRGKDTWVRISWDEALDIVASETKRISAKYGFNSIYAPGGSEIQRTLALAGGYVENYGSTSRGAWRQGQMPITGTTAGVEMNDRLDLPNARLIVMWGNNPGWSAGGLPAYNFLQAKRAGVKFIFVDPFLNPTASIMADEWIPIRPGTDTTMLLAMAYVMLTEDDPKTNPLIDWDFLNRCTVGFDKDHMPEGADPKENFKDYVLGVLDGQPKTPEWASLICGVPVEKIRSFTREVAITKPATVLFGWNMARMEKAQHVCLATIAVGAMTGNMGKPGAAFGISCHTSASNGGPMLATFGGSGIPAIKNPMTQYKLCSNEHWKAIVEGKYTAGKGPKKDINIQMIYHGGSSKLNQTQAINRGVEAHRKVEFVVTHQFSLNTNAKYSDVVLPITSAWERPNTFLTGNREIVIWTSQVIEPMFEAKSDLWIAREVGKRLGLDVNQIDPVSDNQQVYNQLAGAKVAKPDGSGMELLVTITDADIAEMGVTGKPQTGRITIKEFREKGIYQVPRKFGDKLTYIHNKAFREDPVKNKLATKSGKLSIHCQELADIVTNAGWNQGHPIAIYEPATEGYEATFSDFQKQIKGKYPLQLANIHYPRRVHSVMDNVPALREAWGQSLMMNPYDAEYRGLQQGDTVRVFNSNGSVLRHVQVTPFAMPGVVFLGEGAWAEFDADGDDKAGATNTLCGDYASGPDIESWQACIAQVEKSSKVLPDDYTWPQRIPLPEAKNV
jgi:anaerobic dimethyl sulfoxide reductase subunit A